jgi:hypothetical protein
LGINLNLQVFGDAATVIGIRPRKVVNHSILNIAVALAQSADEIADQFIALPIFKRAVTLTRLSEIQRTANRLGRDVTGNERAMINNAFRFRSFDYF